MEAKKKDVERHAGRVGAALADACNVKRGGGVFKSESSGLYFTISPPAEQVAEATTSLGRREYVLALPRLGARRGFFLGAHEEWEPVGRKNRLRFRACALRVYVGTDDASPAPLARLEWVAGREDKEGVIAYAGGHAGHPHWQVDENVLAPPHPDLALDISATVEDFAPDDLGEDRAGISTDGFTWFGRLHLPAHGGWMEKAWGEDAGVPGPHQNTPERIEQLDLWWRGSIRYIVAELQTHGLG